MLYPQQPVDWVSGDKIVIAPTGRDGNETEVSGMEIQLISRQTYGITV